MALRALTTDLENFWEDQNQKLLAHPAFLSEDGNLFDNVLCFKDSKGFVSRLDLSVFCSNHIKLESAALLNIKEETCNGQQKPDT